MRVIGVIAEYNPFHLGHAWQLQEARRLSGADYVVVVMSSCFTQRGDAALFSPADRARMALHCGADAVFALPACWAVRDAEHFALGGIALLQRLGCTAVSFGTESSDLTQLQQAAHLLEHPDAVFDAAVQRVLGTGVPYPAAVSAAMEERMPGLGHLLATPNSTLGICYLRAMLRLNAHMEVFPVARTSGYHNTALTDALPSATAIRGAILRGDWTSVRKAMPCEAFQVVQSAAREGRLHRPDALDNALLYRLRTMTPADYAALPDLSEGIEDRLHAAAQNALSRESLLQRAKTRRYPYARLSRLATHALLNLQDVSLPCTITSPSAWLLGLRSEAKPLFTHIRENGSIPVMGKVADHARTDSWFCTELRAYDLWSLGAGMPAGLALTQGVVRV